MEMGDSGDGDSYGLGFLFDTSGLGLVGTIVVLVVILGIHCYCDGRTHEQRHEFCADVCKQYDDTPVIQGSQCYCRDDNGIYDPATHRTEH